MSDRDLTLLLRAWGGGDVSAGELLFPVIYEELLALARSHKVGATESLNPTALVHEAFIQIANGGRADWRDRTQFYAFAAVVMRRLMLQYVRQQQTEKRGGGMERVVLDEVVGSLIPKGINIEELDSALTRLRELNETQARIVEMRFFGGLSVEETAECLGVSTRTVSRNWGLAKAWLAGHLGNVP